MAVLGVDLGLKRTGIAFSDPGEVIAFPGPVIQGDEAACLRRIAEEAAARGVSEIVIGLPRNMDGSEGPMGARVAAFADKLRAAVPARVVTWDERLTSVQADRAMLVGDLSRKKRKKRIDALAAQLMLQSYLDARRRADA